VRDRFARAFGQRAYGGQHARQAASRPANVEIGQGNVGHVGCGNQAARGKASAEASSTVPPNRRSQGLQQRAPFVAALGVVEAGVGWWTKSSRRRAARRAARPATPRGCRRRA
jgi:hypothetical protein